MGNVETKKPSSAHLLHPCDGNICFHLPGTALTGEIIIDFSSAEKKALDTLWVLGSRATVWDDTLEIGACNRAQDAVFGYWILFKSDKAADSISAFLWDLLQLYKRG